MLLYELMLQFLDVKLPLPGTIHIKHYYIMWTDLSRCSPSKEVAKYANELTNHRFRKFSDQPIEWRFM